MLESRIVAEQLNVRSLPRYIRRSARCFSPRGGGRHCKEGREGQERLGKVLEFVDRQAQEDEIVDVRRRLCCGKHPGANPGRGVGGECPLKVVLL